MRSFVKRLTKEQRVRVIALILGLLLVGVALAGCRPGPSADRDIYERIHNALLSMRGYQADATVTYISNKSQHTYQVRQFARMSGEYRIEVTGPERVAGNITVNDNRTITQFNTNIRGAYAVNTHESPERLELFVTSFVRNYLRSQEVTISVAAAESGLATVLEAMIPGEHPYMRTSKLWVCNNTLLPLRLVIYDADGVERVIVVYENFEFNVDLDDNLFRVQ